MIFRSSTFRRGGHRLRSDQRFGGLRLRDDAFAPAKAYDTAIAKALEEDTKDDLPQDHEGRPRRDPQLYTAREVAS